jgi:hypothetical protein
MRRTRKREERIGGKLIISELFKVYCNRFPKRRPFRRMSVKLADQPVSVHVLPHSLAVLAPSLFPCQSSRDLIPLWVSICEGRVPARQVYVSRSAERSQRFTRDSLHRKIRPRMRRDRVLWHVTIHHALLPDALHHRPFQ